MFLAFRHILASPERLEICEVKTLPLLHRVRQVEGRTRLDVIDMPATAAVIVPSHAGLESGFDPADQEITVAAEHRKRKRSFLEARSFKYESQSLPTIQNDFVNRVVLAPCILFWFISLSEQFDFVRMFCTVICRSFAERFPVSFCVLLLGFADSLWIFYSALFDHGIGFLRMSRPVASCSATSGCPFFFKIFCSVPGCSQSVFLSIFFRVFCAIARVLDLSFSWVFRAIAGRFDSSWCRASGHHYLYRLKPIMVN
jgi:hypothetical protein